MCIPAFNQVKHLKTTIDSVLRQTYTDYEIVITDDTPGDLVKNFVAQYNLPERIKYFKNIKTLGSPENWNESIRKSTGDYIKILHHDDWLNFDDSLAKYVRLLDDNPQVDFGFSATQAIFPKGKDWVHRITDEQLAGMQANPLVLYNANYIGAPSTTIFRRDLSHLFDNNLKWLVDIQYYLTQLGNNNKVAYSPELLVVTFLTDGRVTHDCAGNRQVEVFEYLYLLNQICAHQYLYTAEAIKKCMLKAIYICRNYKIKSVADIQQCGYHGKIPTNIKTYLGVNAISTALGELIIMMIRTKLYISKRAMAVDTRPT